VPRRKISEFRSKKIINKTLGLSYIGWEIIDGKIPKISNKYNFVLKVDQAIKQRFKRGLIYLDLDGSELSDAGKILTRKGYNYLLVEPYYTHEDKDERYISVVREREGVILSYSRLGGVDIENNRDKIKTGLIRDINMAKVAKDTGLTEKQLIDLIETFNTQHMSLLEINPYTIKNNELKILDAAIEVDSSAEMLVGEWSEDDFRSPTTKLTKEELNVKRLNNESPASFSLEVINPNGEIFLLLSGGGASVVIADEIFMMGGGKKIANYGEYSGNPNTEETEFYSEQVVKLMLKSKADKKVALIGGAVANFTDIKNTFEGIINVLEKYGDELHAQDVKIYVRRGGPRQAEGLKAISSVLKRLDILGGVYDPSVTIPDAVSSLVKGLK